MWFHLTYFKWNNNNWLEISGFEVETTVCSSFCSLAAAMSSQLGDKQNLGKEPQGLWIFSIPSPPAPWRQLAGQHQRYPAQLTLPKPASRGRKYQHVVPSPPISQKQEEQLASSKDCCCPVGLPEMSPVFPWQSHGQMACSEPWWEGEGAGLSNSLLKCEKREGQMERSGIRKNDRGEILWKN